MIRTSLLPVLLVVTLAACAGPASTTTTSPAAPSSTTTIPDFTTSSTTTTSTTMPPTSTTTSTIETEDEMTVFEIGVESSEVTGGGRLQTELGAAVRLVVAADLDDSVHLHGYDLLAEVTPGQPATIEFTADIPGVFEVELEDSGLKLAQLEVGP